MKVRELVMKLMLMDSEARVMVDCSSDYPDCGEIQDCQMWGDIDKEERNRYNYGWSSPHDDDVYLS